ncbi:MAG: sodium:solute symporter [Promethearchaeota archaeon]
MAFSQQDMVVFWLTFAAYLVLLVIMGVISKRRTKNITDFMVASRGIGSLLTGLSYGVTYFSAVLLIGCPGLTWMLGSQWMIVTLMNLGFGTFAAFLILGERTRSMSEKLGALTLPELIAERYQDEKVIRPLAGIVIAVFQVIYLVSIFNGLSLLLQIMFPGVEEAYTIAVVLCGCITAAYLVIGGSHSAILSDLLESMVMLAGLLTITIAGVVVAGGLSGLNANIYADIAAAGASSLATPPESYYASNPEAWFLFPNVLSMSMVGMALVTTFGTWGSPQMATRFFTAKDRRSIRYGMIVACVWVFVVSFCAWFVGYVGRGQDIPGGATESLKQFAIAQSGSETLPKNWYEYTMPWLLGERQILPLAFAALFLAAVTAASLTTGEKLILVASSAVARDFYQKGVARGKEVSDETTLKITRIAIVVIVFVAVVLALNPPATILDLTMFSWASLNAFTLVPFVAGLYWKGGTKKAVVISGLVALFTAIAWFVLFNPKWRTPGLPIFPPSSEVGSFDLRSLLPESWQAVVPFQMRPGDIHEFIVSQLVAIPTFFVVSALDRKGKPDREFLDGLFSHITADTNE